MFTVRTSEEDVEKAKKCGAEGFIGKPFITEELVQKVNDFLNEN